MMAVKHKEVECEEPAPAASGEYMVVLLRILQEFRQNPATLPQGHDLDKLCSVIVEALSVLPVPTEAVSVGKFSLDGDKIQDFLKFLCNKEENRDHLIYVVLKRLYSIISEPDAKPSAALSVILNLIEPGKLPHVVKLILDEEQDEKCLQQALLTLCLWMNYCSKSPNLGECIHIFIQGLEEQQRFGILRNVAANVVDKLIGCVVLPTYRLSVGSLISYMLSKMLDDPTAFHKIVPLVPYVVEHLKMENTPNSNGFAQDLVNLCKALSEHFSRYESLHLPLEKAYRLYKPSNYRGYLSSTPWGIPSSLAVVTFRDHGKVGLVNLGNTCYANSVLQALFMTKVFANAILLQTPPAGRVSTKLQNLFAMMQFSSAVWLAPREFIQAQPVKFDIGVQHDASEFMVNVFETLHQECKSCAGPDNEDTSTVVQEWFGGRAETVYKCLQCGAQSVSRDDFRELSLSFPNTWVSGGNVQLLLDDLQEPEGLYGENKYHCDRCATLTDGERTFRVLEPPPRLVLTLKHFQYDPARNLRSKLLHRVTYEERVRLVNADYELYAAVIHSGDHIDSGHYYVHACDSNGWFHFNDTLVSGLRHHGLHALATTDTPYILFYRRIGTEDSVPLQRSQLPQHVEEMLRREVPALDAERRMYPMPDTKNEDPPPPPGCGGANNPVPNNGYVC